MDFLEACWEASRVSLLIRIKLKSLSNFELPGASREPLGRLLGATGGVAKASREPAWSLPGDSREPLGRRKSLTGASLEPPQGLSRASWESPAVFKTCPHPPMARECQLSYRNKAEPTCKRGSLVDQRPVLLAEDVEKGVGGMGAALMNHLEII